MTGTTFVLSEKITKKIRLLQKQRHDTTASQTIRFLILKGLKIAVIDAESSEKP